HQVKIRGYRIELGEIESVLLECPGVREAVVVARQDAPGDARLAAYLVPAARGAVTAEAARTYARGRLPEFMVPAHVAVLEALPLTPNGKVNRRALPAPAALAPSSAAAAFVAPTGDLEQTIAAIWKDVLRVPEVGTHDNFFDLGGHSLLAVQVHRRLRETLARDLSITDVFRFPTIRSLSTYLSEGSGAAASEEGKERAEGRRTAMQRRRRTERPG
ncbi:MAG: hypothetical protein HOP28_07830, partial [Gemmatimonadales bacterium]|nr:hypothetical protein [Gemmatimonadales bacterium]